MNSRGSKFRIKQFQVYSKVLRSVTNCGNCILTLVTNASISTIKKNKNPSLYFQTCSSPVTVIERAVENVAVTQPSVAAAFSPPVSGSFMDPLEKVHGLLGVLRPQFENLWPDGFHTFVERIKKRTVSVQKTAYSHGTGLLPSMVSYYY